MLSLLSTGVSLEKEHRYGESAVIMVFLRRRRDQGRGLCSVTNVNFGQPSPPLAPSFQQRLRGISRLNEPEVHDFRGVSQSPISNCFKIGRYSKAHRE